MAADALSLLFELDADGEPSVKEFKRVSAAFAAELASMQQMAASAVKLSLVESRAPSGPGDGAAASKATLDSQQEVNRQLEAMWAAREKEQEASLKKQADTDRVFASQQVETAHEVEKEIANAYKDRESQLAKTAKQSEDAWTKHEAAKLAATKQAEKEGEAVVAAASAAKDKAAKQASDDFLKQQKQTAAIVARANAQTAATEVAAALVAAKGTADVSAIATQGIEALSDHLNLFVARRIPLAGGAFIRLSENVRGFITLSKETEGSVLRLGNIIADLSSKTGKSAPEIRDFLNSFAKLGTQVEKDEAAVSAFGPALAQKLIPQLAAADSEMSALTASARKTGGAFAAIAGPVGIAVLAVAAVVTAAVLAEKKIFDLAEATAEFEGKFKDLTQQVGLGAEILSTLANAAQDVGSDIDAIIPALGIFQKHLEDAQDPMSESAGLLGELGVQTRDTESALRQTFAALAKMPEGFTQVATAQKLFGREGRIVLALIKESNGDLDAAIKKYKDLGEVVSDEDADAAQKFNIQLTDLHREFDALTRQLGKEFLPAATDIVTALSELVKGSKEWFDLLGFIGKPVIDTFAGGLRGLSLVISAIRQDAETTAKILQDLEDRKNIASIKVPDITPVPLPTGEESALKKAGEEARLVKAEVSDAIRFAESQMAAIDRQLKLREISPAEALEPVIALERAKTEAEIRELERRRDARAKDFTQTEKDRQKQADDIQAIDEEINNKRTQADKFEADKRAEFRAQELQQEQEHRRALAEIFVNALNDRIAAVSRSAQAGVSSPLFAQDVTTRLLEESFDKRKEILEKEREEAGKDPALAQKINDQLADLQRQRTATLAEQTDRRAEILRDEQRKQLDLQRQTIDSFLRAIEITDNSRIATIKALADLRVKTEEQAAREIQKIRLDAIDREKENAQAERDVIEGQIKQRLDGFFQERQKLQQQLDRISEPDTSKSIAERTERQKQRDQLLAQIQANIDAELDAQKKANKDRENADTDLNNKIRALKAQRAQIEAEGNRDIDKGRQDDLENLQRYADDLQSVQEDINTIQRDSARFLIDELIRLRASRKQIILAQRDFDIQQENERSQREQERLRKDQATVNTQIAELKRRIEALKEAGKEETDEYQSEVEALKKATLQKAALEESQTASVKTNTARRNAINEQAARDAERSTPLGKLEIDDQDLSDFVDTIQDSVVPLNKILADSFLQVADAIGSVVEQWVLYGETGPAVMRKILATALATIAKEATINAIKELAIGFALLATGQPGAGAAFTSAALWAAIAGGSALLGRAVAGDSFKQKDTASRAVNGGEQSPRNATFNFGGPGTETSSRATQDGSGGPIVDALNRQSDAIDRQSAALKQHTVATLQLNATVSRLKTEPKGVVVSDGLQQNPAAAGRAVLVHSGENNDFNAELLRNMSFR
jgi:hypothetical protein